MSAKRKTPAKGFIIVIEYPNSSQTFMFDGTFMFDDKGMPFIPEKGAEWEKFWDTTPWRYANEVEYKAFIAELQKNGLYYDTKTNELSVIKECKLQSAIKTQNKNESDNIDVEKYFVNEPIEFSNEFPCGVSFRNESDKEVAYKAEIVRLWKLIEEMGMMADLSINGCDKLFDSKMGKIGDKAMLRFKNVKSDGYNLFFGDEQLTNNKHDYRIYDYGK